MFTQMLMRSERQRAARMLFAAVLRLRVSIYALRRMTAARSAAQRSAMRLERAARFRAAATRVAFVRRRYAYAYFLLSPPMIYVATLLCYATPRCQRD